MDWLVALTLLVVFGGFALRDAWTDKTPQAPEQQWWGRRLLVQPWWAKRATARERRASHIPLKPRS